jgi:glycine/D-amino acid oxidase-like deaminating enzyme
VRQPELEKTHANGAGVFGLSTALHLARKGERTIREEWDLSPGPDGRQATRTSQCSTTSRTTRTHTTPARGATLRARTSTRSTDAHSM